MVHIHYSCSSDTAKPFLSCIKNVFERLPQKNQDKIDKNCMIFLIGETYGYSIGVLQKHVILINIDSLKYDHISFQEIEYIIAHEFAHFILNHKQSTPVKEQEAKNLVAKWGFSI